LIQRGKLQKVELGTKGKLQKAELGTKGKLQKAELGTKGKLQRAEEGQICQAGMLLPFAGACLRVACLFPALSSLPCAACPLYQVFQVP